MLITQKFVNKLARKFKAIYPDAVIQTGRTSGLCSFYAEDEGILMGYEI